MILHAEQQGRGPDILLLHGLFGAAKNLGALARPLAAEARVTALDLRNHGASPHDAGMDYATMAADVAETMDHLALPHAAVVGHSMGGKTAMALALAAPARVDRLAVLDIAPIAYRHGYDAYVGAMRSLPLAAALTRHAADAALAETIPEAPMRAFLLNNLILGTSPHWRIGLAEIAAGLPALMGWDYAGAGGYAGPSIFIRGGDSDYVPDSAGPAIAALFPAAVIRTIPDATHWLHADQPAAVVAALRDFLFP